MVGHTGGPAGPLTAPCSMFKLLACSNRAASLPRCWCSPGQGARVAALRWRPPPLKLARIGAPPRVSLPAHGDHTPAQAQGLAPRRSGGGGLAVAALRPPGLLPLLPACTGGPAPGAAGLPLLGGRALDVPRLEGSGAAGAGRPAGLPGPCRSEGGREAGHRAPAQPPAAALGPGRPGSPGCPARHPPPPASPAHRCPSTPCARPAPR